MIPSRVIAVDWSGARSGAHRKIWLAEARDGKIVRLENGRSREQTTAELTRAFRESAATGERLVIGLDFAFAVPAWYAARQHWHDARDMWAAFTPSEVDAMLHDPPFPFWGRGAQRTRPAALSQLETPALRATEAELSGARAFSVFQLVGAGAVGTASLRGMATLHALDRAGACIWPFSDDAGDAGAVVIEIWPRLFAPRVNKSDVDARVAFAHAQPGWSASVNVYEKELEHSDDAFDALVSACAMWDARESLSHLPLARDAQQRIEGCIWKSPVTSRVVRDERSPVRV